MLLPSIEPIYCGGSLEQGRSNQQIVLLEKIKQWIELPVGCVEAFIAIFRLNDRGNALTSAPAFERRGSHHLCVLLSKINIIVPGTHRVTTGAKPHLLKSMHDGGWIKRRNSAARVSFPELA